MLAGAASTLSLPGRSDPPTGANLPPTTILPNQAKKASLVREFGRLPLSFESNQGQTDARVRFLTHSGDSTLFLTPSEAVFTMPGKASTPRQEQNSLWKGRTARRAAEQIARVALRMQMIGSNANASALQQQPLGGRINYFIGSDAGKWQSGVPTFGRVGFHQVYPGVDLVYYGNQRHLEYDFVVAPHADPKQIKLHFAGAEGVRVNAAGDLLVRAQGRELRWQKPTVYQQDGAGKHRVAARFRLKRLANGQAGVSFALGRYDAARAVVIDPVLLYSSYLGGSSNDQANSIAVDSAGNAYVTGFSYSTNFPVTAGVFQTAKQGIANTYNAFVTKFNSTGTALLYSTYLGGSTGDQANSIAVDSNGNAYVTGFSYSTDYPTTLGAFQRVKQSGANAYNAFVTKLNATGTALLYSTYLGGSSVDGDQANGIVIDSNGSAYVTGYAYSANFPTTAGAFQTVKQGAGNIYNAFVTKLNPTGTALIYSTFLGGSNFDQAHGIAIDNSGSAYVTGPASSADFPTTPGAFQRVKFSANANAFVTKLNSTGTGLVYSTYLGGSSGSGDAGFGISVDSNGSAYVTGLAASADFPTTASAFQRVNNEPAGFRNAFVTKLNSTGTGLVYSTYLGGSGKNGDEARGIVIDSSGSAYVTGFANSTDFPTTSGAFQRVKNGGLFKYNAFVTKLNSMGTALLYSTYLGGSGSFDDLAHGIAIDNSGNAYVTGTATSTDFPTTSGAFQRVKNTASNVNAAFVTKLSAKPIFPDFNNDGNTDLLIQNSTTNAIASWFMVGSQQNGGAYFSLTPPAEYALVGVGDFSGNGGTTLVLQSRNTNQIAFWYTSGVNGATIPGGIFVNLTPAAGYKVVGVGDFNGDGKSDLVFQNQTTNQVAIWFMNGAVYTGGVLLPFVPPAGWQVAGAGDFNADGFTDLVFQNQSTGQIVLWYMNGTTYVGGTALSATPASGWKVVGVGDYNGDGSADLLFQNQTTNLAAVWYLQNGAFAGGDLLSLTPPSGWKIVGPR